MNPDRAAYVWHLVDAALGVTVAVVAIVGLVGHLRIRRRWVMVSREQANR